MCLWFSFVNGILAFTFRALISLSTILFNVKVGCWCILWCSAVCMPSSGDKSKCPRPAIYQNFSTLHIVLSYKCVFLFICTYLLRKKNSCFSLVCGEKCKKRLGREKRRWRPRFLLTCGARFRFHNGGRGIRRLVGKHARKCLQSASHSPFSKTAWVLGFQVLSHFIQDLQRI